MTSKESIVISPFDLLPDEIWLRIFTELPVETICFCRVVNLTVFAFFSRSLYIMLNRFLYRYLRNGTIYHRMKRYGSIIVHYYLNLDLYHQELAQHYIAGKIFIDFN